MNINHRAIERIYRVSLAASDAKGATPQVSALYFVPQGPDKVMVLASDGFICAFAIVDIPAHGITEPSMLPAKSLKRATKANDIHNQAIMDTLKPAFPLWASICRLLPASGAKLASAEPILANKTMAPLADVLGCDPYHCAYQHPTSNVYVFHGSDGVWAMGMRGSHKVGESIEFPTWEKPE